jgi:hypothetical protein
MDQLAKKLNLKKLEDWYSVGTKTIQEEGGSFLVSYYNGSLIKGN